MPANLIVPLARADYDVLIVDTSEEVVAALADPLFVFDAITPAVEIHGEFRELGKSSIRRRFRDRLSRVLSEPEPAIAQFGTPAYQALNATRRDQARAALAGVAPPLLGALAMPPAPGVTGQMSAREGVQHELNNGGMVLGYKHSDQGSKDLTVDLIRQVGGAGLRHLFIEEFASELQNDIDDFLNDAAAVFSPALLARLQTLRLDLQADFEPMLHAAREKGVRIWGIDSDAAEPQVAKNDPRYHERRLALMNAEAKRVFDHVQLTHPGEPFLALTGHAHVNTADGGTPGLAQIMGVSGYTLDADSKKLAFMPEDTGKRVALSALEHLCREEILKRAGAEYPPFVALYKTSPAYTDLPADPTRRVNEVLNQLEATVIAQQLAAQFTGAGQLTLPGDVPGLVAGAAVNAALTTLFNATVMRDERKKRVKADIEAGDLATVQAALNADPYLASVPLDSSLKNTLLHHASAAGQAAIVQDLIVRGMNPNAVDLKGRSPLHMALLADKGAAPPAAHLAGVVGHLLGAGADATLADPSGNTGVGLAKSGGRADGGIVERFVAAGAASATDIFVTRFTSDVVAAYAAVKVIGGAPPDAAEARTAAATLAGALAHSGVPLGDAGQVDTAMGAAQVHAERDRLVQLWQARAQRKLDTVAAIKAKDLASLQAALNADPWLAHIPIDSNNQMALGLAAVEGDHAALAELINVHGVDVNQKSPRGRTALHEVLSQETSKTNQVAQNSVTANALVLINAHGADVNARNGGGETALHLAGFRNNTSMIDALAQRLGTPNAPDPALRDNRGWTALDTTMASTNREAEDSLHGQGLGGTAPPLQAGALTSVDILAQAVCCQDALDAMKARKFIERLYANEPLRPMLDLAAAAACNDRNPPNGGLRLFASKTHLVGSLFGKTVGPTAAYDEKVNTLLFPLADDPGDGKEGDAIGSLAHELTHLTAHLVTDDPATLPFSDDGEKALYLAAIDGDVRKLHLLDDADPVQKFIKDRFSGRMDSYKDHPGTGIAKTGPEFDASLMQEFIVGVPQFAAVYGMAELEKHMPGLTNYYKNVWTPKVQATLANDPRFANGRAKIDTLANQLAAQALERRPDRLGRPVTPVLIKKDDPQLNIDTLMAKIEADVVATLGAPRPGLPNTPTVNYKNDNYVLSAPDRLAFDKSRPNVRAAVLQALQGDSMPREIDLGEIRALVESVSDAIRTQPAKDIKAVVANRSANWAKDAKVAFVDRSVASASNVSPADAAQAVIFRAEAEARGGGPGADLDPDTEVKASKQREAIRKLTEALSMPGNLAKLQRDPGLLIASTTAALVTGNRNTAGFYQKPRANAMHVSMNVDRAKRLWLAQLGQLQ